MPPTLRFGNLSVDSFVNSNFTNGNLSFIDGSLGWQTLTGINGSILNGTVPNATFTPGVTATNGTVECTFKAEVRQGKLVNATIVNASIADLTTATDSLFTIGNIQSGGELRKGHLVNATLIKGGVQQGLTTSGTRLSGTLSNATV